MQINGKTSVNISLADNCIQTLCSLSLKHLNCLKCFYNIARAVRISILKVLKDLKVHLEQRLQESKEQCVV